MKSLLIYTDGGARGNPGPGAVGVRILAESGQILASLHQRIGETTNNIAEYTAVIKALEWVRDNLTMKQFNNETMITFYLDSTLVVNQLNGLFKVKDPNLRNMVVKVRELEHAAGGNVSYTYIPREKNREADALVNKALDDI